MIRMDSDAAWASDSSPTRMEFFTCKAGAVNVVAASPDMSIYESGQVTTASNVWIANELTVASTMTTMDMWRQATTWHAYGGFQDEDYTLTLASQQWKIISNATADLWTGLEADGLTLTDDKMTFTNGGDYIGAVSITFSALNGKDYEIRLYNNTQGTQMGYKIGGSTTGTSNFKNVNLPLYIEADAGDEMEMQIQNTTDSTQVILRSAVFYITYLHD